MSATGGKDLAGGKRCRADAGHGVGGTAAQHRGGVHAAAYGEVAAETALRRADGQGFAVEQGEGVAIGTVGPDRSRTSSDSRVNGQFRRRPGDGEDLVPDGRTLSPPATVSIAAADGAFPTRRLARRSEARSSAPAAETPRAEWP